MKFERRQFSEECPASRQSQGLAAAVQGIESLLHDQREVKSIQEHARNVRWENVVAWRP